MRGHRQEKYVLYKKMRYIISRYNHNMTPILEYAKNYVLYDRSEEPLPEAIKVKNIGSDIYDKFTFIIDNYDNLPDVAVYTKANLFKYITKEEFDNIKNNKTFTPLLTQHHKVYEPVCRYNNGMYEEINNYWYLDVHKPKSKESAEELKDLLGMRNREYNAFAPGSSYILPKENILQHSKDFYIKLRSFLDWAVYPGEAQMIERSLYYLWQ